MQQTFLSTKQSTSPKWNQTHTISWEWDIGQQALGKGSIIQCAGKPESKQDMGEGASSLDEWQMHVIYLKL